MPDPLFPGVRGQDWFIDDENYVVQESTNTRVACLTANGHTVEVMDARDGGWSRIATFHPDDGNTSDDRNGTEWLGTMTIEGVIAHFFELS